MRRSGSMRFWILGAAATCALTQTGARSLEAPAQLPAEVSLGIEDFEGTTLGARPYLWDEKKSGGTATIGAEKAAQGGMAANKALKLEYTFLATFDPSQ